jgi:polyisoprenyl-phosphate glycosyltransferase
MYSLIVPVYGNEASLPSLLAAIDEKIARQLRDPLELVFVVDGSPDGSYAWLRSYLATHDGAAQLLLHARNFGSFAAIRSGLRAARGNYYAVLAADLQEPPELVVQFFQSLQLENMDVVIGTRESRDDPFFSKLSSSIFWSFYKKFVQPQMPAGGIDMFGCNRRFRDELLALPERNSSLVGLLLWLGFQRKTIGYHRRAREHGKSAWTLKKKINYLLDSVFAFSDLPLKLLMSVGGLAMLAAFMLGIIVLVGRLTGHINVPGYTMLILVISFFGALNTFALGVVGSYVWRAFENTKGRPQAIVAEHLQFGNRA